MDVGLVLLLLMLFVQGAVVVLLLCSLKTVGLKQFSLSTLKGAEGGMNISSPPSAVFLMGCCVLSFTQVPCRLYYTAVSAGNFIFLVNSLASTSNWIGNLILEACTAFIINSVFQDSWISTPLHNRLIQETHRIGCKNT